MSVLIVGSVALDSVKTPLGEANNVLGGSAVYASYAASFYGPVKLVGVIGEDFPQEHIELLKSRSIDLEGLQVRKGKTFYWSGYYELDMNQAHSLCTELNVFSCFHPHIPKSYRKTKYIFLANIDPELQMEVLTQVEKPDLVVADTMNYWIMNKHDAVWKILKAVDIVLLNDAEARQLCGTANLVKAAKKVIATGPKVVIIKKGEHGSLMITDSTTFAAPAYPLETIYDPTGAGDTFAGGFIGYLAATKDLSEKNLRKAVIIGSTLASFNVEDFSLGRLIRLTQSELTERYKAFRKLVRF
ncbi:MAG: PfkB family carbohydrate kinase [bacterium]|nr:PfkB family carbohydrate kinase [bacterium]